MVDDTPVREDLKGDDGREREKPVSNVGDFELSIPDRDATLLSEKGLGDRGPRGYDAILECDGPDVGEDSSVVLSSKNAIRSPTRGPNADLSGVEGRAPGSVDARV